MTKIQKNDQDITSNIKNEEYSFYRIGLFIKIVIGALLIISITMVFSSSTIIKHLAKYDGSDFLKSQAMFVVFGILLALFLSQIRIYIYTKFAYFMMIICVFLNIWTGLFAAENNGNKSWLKIGFLPAFQPSELLKLSFCIFVPICVYVFKTKYKFKPNKNKIRFCLSSIAVIGLGLFSVVMQKDMGTLLVIGFMLLGQLFLSGLRVRYICLLISVATLGFYMMLSIDKGRIDRITATYTGCDNLENDSLCAQQNAGIQALESGALTGRGAGRSREKWLYLPEPHTDFIFTVFGEEFGFFGTITLLALYVVLIAMLIIIIIKCNDIRMKLITAGVTCWIFFQTSFNIFVTIGILPVLGVTLPFVSYGGSSIISLMAAIGVILSFISEKRIINRFYKRFEKYSKQTRSVNIVN